MHVPEAGRQVSPSNIRGKLTDAWEPSVPSGVAEAEGKQIVQGSSRKFGMERVFAAIRNGRLGGHVLDQTTGY